MRVYERFGKENSNKSNIRSSESKADYSSSLLMPPPPSRNIKKFQDNRVSLKKRDNKLSSKQHDKRIDDYLTNKSDISAITKQTYSQILNSFKEFSPKLDPADISDYLKFKFELVGVQNEDKIKIYGNAAKYANCLKQYFKSMGIKVDLGFKSAYKSMHDEVLAPIKSKVTLK